MMAKVKKTIESLDEDVEKLKISYTADRNVKWCSHFKMWSSSSSNDETWSYHTAQQLYSYVNAPKNWKPSCSCENFPWLFTAGLFTTSQKIEATQLSKTTQMSITGHMYKQNVVQPHSGILVSLKKNEVLTQATVWINLGNTCSMKEFRHRKLYYSLTWRVQNKQNRRREQISGYQGSG